jgi:tape measure domain-containing protein
MSLSLGTLEIGLGLNTAQYDSGIKSAKDQLSSLERRVTKLGTTPLKIKVSVDDRQLYGLNSHLLLKRVDLKKTVDFYKANPIKVFAEDDALVSLNQELRELKKTSVEIGTPSKIVVEHRFSGYQDRVEKAIDRSTSRISSEIRISSSKGGVAGAIGRILMSPFKLAGRVLDDMVTGYFEKLGQSFAEEIGVTSAKNTAKKIKSAITKIDEQLIGKNQVYETFLSEFFRSGSIEKATQASFPRTEVGKTTERLQKLQEIALVPANKPLERLRLIKENSELNKIYQQVLQKIESENPGIKPREAGKKAMAQFLVDAQPQTQVLKGFVNSFIQEMAPLLKFIQGMRSYRTSVESQKYYNERKAGFPLLREGEDVVSVIGGAQFKGGQGGRQVVQSIELLAPNKRFIPVENPETDTDKQNPNLLEKMIRDKITEIAPDFAAGETIDTAINAFRQVVNAINPFSYSTAAAQAIANTRLAEEQGKKGSVVSYSLGGADNLQYAQTAAYLGMQPRGLAMAYPFLNFTQNTPKGFNAALLSGDPLGFAKLLGIGVNTNQFHSIESNTPFGLSNHHQKHLFKEQPFLDLFYKTINAEQPDMTPGQQSKVVHAGDKLYEVLGSTLQLKSLKETGEFDKTLPYHRFLQEYSSGSPNVSVEGFIAKFFEGLRLISSFDTKELQPVSQALKSLMEPLIPFIAKKFRQGGANLPENPQDFAGYQKYQQEAKSINSALLEFKSGKLANIPSWYAGNLEPNEVKRRTEKIRTETIPWFTSEESTFGQTYTKKIVEAYKKIADVADEFIKTGGKLSQKTKDSIKTFEVDEFSGELTSFLNTRLDTSTLPKEEEVRQLQVTVPEIFLKKQSAILAYNKLLNAVGKEILPGISEIKKIGAGMSGAVALLSDNLVYKTDLDPIGATKIASEDEIKAYEKLQGRLSPLLYKAVPGQALITERTQGRPLKEILDRIARPYKEIQQKIQEANKALELAIDNKDATKIKELKVLTKELQSSAKKEHNRFNKAASILYRQVGQLGASLQEMGVVHNDLAAGNVFFAQGGITSIDLGNAKVDPTSSDKFNDKITTIQRAIIDSSYYGLMDPFKIIGAVQSGYSKPFATQVSDSNARQKSAIIPQKREINETLLSPVVTGEAIPLGSYTPTLLKQIVGDFSLPTKETVFAKIDTPEQKKEQPILDNQLQKLNDLAATAKSKLEDVLASRLGTPDKSGEIQHLSGNEDFAELLQLTLVRELKTASLLLSKAFRDTSLDVIKFGQVVYAVLKAIERPVMALPGAAIGKKAIQVGGTAAMGAAALHALPMGLDATVVNTMRDILAGAMSAGGREMIQAVATQMTQAFSGLPFGVGQQLTEAVVQLVTEITNGTISVLSQGGAVAGSALMAGEGVKKLLGAATSNVPKLISKEEQQKIEGKTQKALKAAKNKADSLITTEITPYFDERVFPVSNPIPANIKAINPEYYTVKQLRGLARNQGIDVPASGAGARKEEIWKSLTEKFNPDQLTRLLLTTKASDRTKLGKKELSGFQIASTEIPADFTKRIGIGIKNIGQEINTTKDIQSLERLYFQLEKVKKGITALRANPEFNTTNINKSLSGFLQSVDNLQTQILAKGGLESGKNLNKGLAKGLKDTSASDIAYQNALKIVDATNKGLGNASPSWKGEEAGENLIKGVAIGIEKGISSFDFRSLANEVVKGFESGLSLGDIEKIIQSYFDVNIPNLKDLAVEAKMMGWEGKPIDGLLEKKLSKFPLSKTFTPVEPPKNDIISYPTPTRLIESSLPSENALASASIRLKQLSNFYAGHKTAFANLQAILTQGIDPTFNQWSLRRDRFDFEKQVFKEPVAYSAINSFSEPIKGNDYYGDAEIMLDIAKIANRSTFTRGDSGAFWRNPSEIITNPLSSFTPDQYNRRPNEILEYLEVQTTGKIDPSDFLGINLGDIEEKYSIYGRKLIEVIASSLSAGVPVFAKNLEAISSIFSSEGRQSGLNYIKGLNIGLQNNNSEKYALDVAIGIIDATNKGLGNASPSKKAMKAMRFFYEGLALGARHIRFGLRLETQFDKEVSDFTFFVGMRSKEARKAILQAVKEMGLGRGERLAAINEIQGSMNTGIFASPRAFQVMKRATVIARPKTTREEILDDWNKKRDNIFNALDSIEKAGVSSGFTDGIVSGLKAVIAQADGFINFLSVGGKALRTLDQELNAATGGMVNLRKGAIAAIGGFALFKGAEFLLRPLFFAIDDIPFRIQQAVTDSLLAFTELQRIKLNLNLAGVGNVEQSLDALVARADRLGISFKESAIAYSKFKLLTTDSPLQAQADNIFEGFQEALSARQTNTQQQAESFRAIGQMASRTVVSVEEFTQQLSESGGLNDALNVAARSMGLTTAQFYQQASAGNLLVQDVLPRLAAEYKRMSAGGLSLSTGTLQSEISRFQNNTEQLQMQLGEKIGVVAYPALQALNAGLSTLNDNLGTVASVGAAGLLSVMGFLGKSVMQFAAAGRLGAVASAAMSASLQTAGVASLSTATAMGRLKVSINLATLAGIGLIKALIIPTAVITGIQFVYNALNAGSEELKQAVRTLEESKKALDAWQNKTDNSNRKGLTSFLPDMELSGGEKFFNVITLGIVYNSKWLMSLLELRQGLENIDKSLATGVGNLKEYQKTLSNFSGSKQFSSELQEIRNNLALVRAERTIASAKGNDRSVSKFNQREQDLMKQEQELINKKLGPVGSRITADLQQYEIALASLEQSFKNKDITDIAYKQRKIDLLTIIGQLKKAEQDYLQVLKDQEKEYRKLQVAFDLAIRTRANANFANEGNSLSRSIGLNQQFASGKINEFQFNVKVQEESLQTAKERIATLGNSANSISNTLNERLSKSANKVLSTYFKEDLEQLNVASFGEAIAENLLSPDAIQQIMDQYESDLKDNAALRAILNQAKEYATARRDILNTEKEIQQISREIIVERKKRQIQEKQASGEIVKAEQLANLANKTSSSQNISYGLEQTKINLAALYNQLALEQEKLVLNVDDPLAVKTAIANITQQIAETELSLRDQQEQIQNYYRNLDRQIIDFNRQIEDYRRQIEDAQLSAFKENRSLSESYSDLVRELDKNLLNAQNQLLDTTDRIRVQQVKNRLLIPGTSDAGKELGDIFLEFVQGQADLASRGRTFQSRTEEIETSYISTLRNIRNLQEQQQEAERNRLRTIEDIKRTQEDLNRTLADLIRQTNKELGFIPQSIKDIVTNLNTLPEPIKLINSELIAIPKNIKTSGEDLVKSIEETAEAIREAKEGLILPAPSNFIPAPVASGRFALGKIGRTGIGNGPHLHLAGQDAKGNVMSKARLMEFFSQVYVDGKPLSEQLDKITSGYGPRRRPVPGASENHLAFDFGFPQGTPLEFRGAASNARSFFTESGGNTVELTLPTGELLKFLHLDSIADLTSIKNARVNTPGNTQRRGMPNVPFASLIEGAARQVGIDPLLFAALIKKESSFHHMDPNHPTQIHESSAGAMGLSQLMPDTAKELGVNPLNPTENLIGGATYLAKMLERFNGNIELALSAYKAGPGNVRNGQLAKGTVKDVAIVMQYYQEFLRQFGRNQGGSPTPSISTPNPSPSVQQQITNRLPKNIQSVLVQEVGGKTVYSKNAQTPPASPASTIKVIIADLIAKEIASGKLSLKDAIAIKSPLVDPHGQLKANQVRTVEQLIQLMLEKSDNTATNVLIDRLGGLTRATELAKKEVYKNTTISRYLNIPGSGTPNISTAQDVTLAMQSLIKDQNPASQLAEQSLRQTRNFKYNNEIGGKIGNNSKVIGNVGLVNINGKEYIVTAYANINGNQLNNRTIITNATNAISQSIKDSTPNPSPVPLPTSVPVLQPPRVLTKEETKEGKGGPEFSSPPPIAQLPTLPNQNQDNFWDADLPPVPKDNPINFQSPNLPPVPDLPTGNLGAAADQIRNAETANQNAEEFSRRLEEQQNLNNALDRSMKFRRQQEEDARALERTLRDASENVADLTINSKGYLTVQEEINKSATEVSRQYRSQIESLQDQRRTLLLNAEAQQKYSDAIKEILGEFQRKGIALPPEFIKEMTDSIDALAKNAELAKKQVAILDQAIEQLGKNQGVATLEASFRKTRDTVRSIRDRLNDLTIQRTQLEFQSRPTLFDDSAILAERISLQKEKEELEDYLEPYKDLPQYADFVANIRSEWEKLAELRLERVALDASPNRGAAESFFSDIREGKGIGSAFSSLGLNIMTKFVEGITKPAIDALTSAIDGFTKPITQAFESLFNAIIGPVGNFFTNALNSIFKPAGNIFSSIFGGGGGGGLFNGLLSGITGIFSGGLGGLGSIGSLGSIGASSFASAPASAFSLGTGFSLFSDGGKVGDANVPIEKNIISAFQRERAMSGGRKPRLIVANEDELVLNPKETEAYLDYRNNAPIKNYANGGFVGGKPNYSTTSNNNSSNQSLVINNTNNVTVESRNDMGYSLNQLKERENTQNERTKKRFFG